MKQNPATSLAYKLNPALSELHGVEQASFLFNMYTFIWTLPLAILSVIWLVAATDLQVLLQSAWLLIILFLTALLFQNYPFELMFELRPGVVATTGGSLTAIVDLSAAFIFGPTACWIIFLAPVISKLNKLRKETNPNNRWGHTTELVTSIANGILAALIGLWVYEKLGGSYPLAALSPQYLIPGVAALLVNWLLPYVVMAPLIIYMTRSPDMIGQGSSTSASGLLSFVLISSTLPNLALPFTILGSILFSSDGPGIYLFFLAGALLACILASRLTENVRLRTQRARELAVLEELGRAILNAPPALSTLPALLSKFIPQMFSIGRALIWLKPDDVLYRTESGYFPTDEQIKQKILQFKLDDDRWIGPPLEDDPQRQALTIPIKSEAGDVLGGIYLSIRAETGSVQNYLPALQSLASQVASAINRIETHQQAITQERMAKELELAGRIQEEFLPEMVPSLVGYEISASLTPARETSGDFYDFIPLPGGNLGIIIADVADKGTGAALFMALSRTLMRTYAFEHPDQPDQVLHLANQRILNDTRSSQFVTTFYGVLNPDRHTLTYANAGHNPPYLLSPDRPGEIESLIHTGMPLGVLEEAIWECKQVSIRPGDTIIMYTDGVTEAHNLNQEMFESQKLLEVCQAELAQPTQVMHDRILEAVQNFKGEAPQFDDITLVIFQRVPPDPELTH
ncbi:MAG: SpoIIE family protein phosphatase [Anaerolineales bacterium]|nr:SpoIIE family protein phosphatase [Anaerolineales bacterium]